MPLTPNKLSEPPIDIEPPAGTPTDASADAPNDAPADVQGDAPTDAPAGASERRVSTRRSMLVAAQLLVGETWHACSIMNVSEGGATIRLEGPCPVAGQAALQIKGHGKMPVKISWQKDAIVGLTFDGPISDVEAFAADIDLAAPSPMEARRHQRCSVLWSIKIFSGGQLIDAMVLNISASGAKVKLVDQAILNERVTLSSERFGDLPARLVWRREGLVGVEFLDPPHLIADMLGNTLPRIQDDMAKDAPND